MSDDKPKPPTQTVELDLTDPDDPTIARFRSGELQLAPEVRQRLLETLAKVVLDDILTRAAKKT